MSAPLPPAMCQVVTVVRDVPGGQDPLGNPLPATQTRTVVGLPEPRKGCSLQPLQGTFSTEQLGASYDQVISRYQLFAPPGADILAADRIQQGADPTVEVTSDADAVLDLQVDGDVARWPGPDGLEHHTQCMLKRWGG